MRRIGRKELEKALKGRLSRVRSTAISLAVAEKTGLTVPVCAFIVSKKVSKLAVERNRIRRRSQEAFTRIQSPVAPAIYLWYPRKEVLDMNFQVLIAEMSRCVQEVAQKASAR